MRRTRRVRGRGGAGLALALALAGAGLVLTPPGSGAAEEVAEASDASSGRLVLVLDSSGSMQERAAGGTTKIRAAREALRDVVERLPDDAEVGMRVFGATVFSRRDRGACSDTQNVVPVGPLDRDAVLDEVDSYEPYGETPIGAALRGAARDLGGSGKRTIVLLSDGEPTCRPDPCVVARQLRKQGVGLKVNVVGLDVAGPARRSLQCIAAAGGGSYLDADDAGELSASLVDVSVRALRTFRVSGTPVTGGPSAAEATELEPGQYVDSLTPGEERTYYRVPKDAGAGMSASVTMRPPSSGESLENTVVRLLTAEGEECAEGDGYRTNVLRENAVLSAGALLVPGRYDHTPEGCATAEELVVELEHDDAVKRRDFELLVQAQPAFVGDVSQLPAPVEQVDDQLGATSAEGTAAPVVGGVSFADAPVLGPGRYRDTVRPGEQLFYRVPIDWGQSARVAFTVAADARADQVLGLPGQTLDTLVFDPVRQPVMSTVTEHAPMYSGSTSSRGVVGTVPVRLLNDYRYSATSVAGDYTFGFRMGQLDKGVEFAAPLTIEVVVDGEPDEAPELDGPLAVASDGEGPGQDDAEAAGADESDESDESAAPESSESADATDPAAGSAAPYVVVLGLLALLLLAGVAWLRRGRTARRRDSHHQDSQRQVP